MIPEKSTPKIIKDFHTRLYLLNIVWQLKNMRNGNNRLMIRSFIFYLLSFIFYLLSFIIINFVKIRENCYFILINFVILKGECISLLYFNQPNLSNYGKYKV